MIWLALPDQAPAQSVADVQAELTLLNGQIQQLRDQLVRQGTSGGLPAQPATALERLDQLESELRRLTNRVDVLTNDIDRIVTDAGNRVGDIEFRLTELEGGEPAPATDTPPEPLGGGLTNPRPRPRSRTSGTAQLAVAEQSDFDAAVAASDQGRHGEAVGLFDRFLAAYPGGPLSSRAQLLRSESLAAEGDWQQAARGYLQAFSGAPQAETAPTALFGLGQSLAQLGKTGEACLTFAEVPIRYPDAPEAGRVAGERMALNCPP